MTDKLLTGRINYDHFTSNEHKSWKLHRQLLLQLEEDDAGYRGCFGISLVVDSSTIDSWTTVTTKPGVGSLVFIPDSTVRWATLVDVPIGYFRLGERSREVHWATVRPTTMKFGVPALVRGSEGRDAWDFRSFPFDKAKMKTPSGRVVQLDAFPDTLKPDSFPQLFRVFNALEWGMTTTAFSYRKNWAYAKKHMFDALGYPYDEGKKLLAFGKNVYDSVARPAQWMPRAYLAFRESHRDDVFDAVTRVGYGGPGAPPVYPDGLKEAFVDAMGTGFAYRAQFDGRVAAVGRIVHRGVAAVEVVLKGDRGERTVVRFTLEGCVLRKRVRDTFVAGDVIGEERLEAGVPPHWYDIPWYSRWEKTAARLLSARRLDPVMRLWFERQAYHLKEGYVHFASQISSIAALGLASDEHLFWEVSDSLDYYHDDSDSMIFPTVQIRGWCDLRGGLPGDVAYDLNPADHRYEEYADQKARIAARNAEKARRGNEPPRPKVVQEPEETPAYLSPYFRIEDYLAERRAEVARVEEAKKRKEALLKQKKDAEKEVAVMKTAFAKNAPRDVPPPDVEVDDEAGINLSPEEQEKIRLAKIVNETLPSWKRKKPRKTT